MVLIKLVHHVLYKKCKLEINISDFVIFKIRIWNMKYSTEEKWRTLYVIVKSEVTILIDITWLTFLHIISSFIDFICATALFKLFLWIDNVLQR